MSARRVGYVVAVPLALLAAIVLVTALSQRDSTSVSAAAREEALPADEERAAARLAALEALPQEILAIIYHIEHDHLDQVAALAEFQPLPCIAPGVPTSRLAPSPTCPEGVPPGSALGRFIVQGCPTVLLDDARPYLEGLLPRVGALYAVAVPASQPGAPPEWPAGEFALVFAPAPDQSPASAAAFYVDHGLIARVHDCVSAQQLIRERLTGPGLPLLVPPP